MTQALIPGSTNYGEQTLSDIQKDIESWINYTKKVKNLFETTILQLSQSGYWYKKVPFSFKGFCQTVPTICDTFITDFNIILNDMYEDNITKRTIKLMQNIARVTSENEELSWRTYKEERQWKEYGEKEFCMAEELYNKGRDFFVALIDVGNAASRMEDYLTEEKKSIVVQGNVDNSTHVESVDNSINIGNGNEIKNSKIGGSTIEIKESVKESWWKKSWKYVIIPLAVAIIAGIVVAIIVHKMGI